MSEYNINKKKNSVQLSPEIRKTIMPTPLALIRSTNARDQPSLFLPQSCPSSREKSKNCNTQKAHEHLNVIEQKCKNTHTFAHNYIQLNAASSGAQCNERIKHLTFPIALVKRKKWKSSVRSQIVLLFTHTYVGSLNSRRFHPKTKCILHFSSGAAHLS